MSESSNELKYNSTNFLKRLFLKKFVENIIRIINPKKNELILDLGCGEGFIAKQLTIKEENIRVIGIDSSKNAIKKAQRAIKQDFLVGDLLTLSRQIKAKKYNTVVMLEVLEHLKDYNKALSKISGLHSKLYIFSVPFEPWFSIGNLLSGENVIRLGTHPEHLNYWNVKTFKKLLSEYFSQVEIKISFPWIIAICKK